MKKTPKAPRDTLTKSKSNITRGAKVQPKKKEESGYNTKYADSLRQQMRSSNTRILQLEKALKKVTKEKIDLIDKGHVTLKMSDNTKRKFKFYEESSYALDVDVLGTQPSQHYQAKV